MPIQRSAVSVRPALSSSFHRSSPPLSLPIVECAVHASRGERDRCASSVLPSSLRTRGGGRERQERGRGIDARAADDTRKNSPNACVLSCPVYYLNYCFQLSCSREHEQIDRNSYTCTLERAQTPRLARLELAFDTLLVMLAWIY